MVKYVKLANKKFNKYELIKIKERSEIKANNKFPFIKMENNPINVDIVIDQTYPIKPSIDPRFILGELLSNQGVHSEVRTACFEGDCSFIVKIIPVDSDYVDPLCFTAKDMVRSELLITKHMSEAGIAPNIYDMSLSDTRGVLVMNRYDGTLDDLLKLYEKDKSIPMDQIMQVIEKLVEKMHEQGVVHRDLNVHNILYTKEGIFVITDFGLSVYSTSEALREIDRIYLRRMKEVYMKIKSGETYLQQLRRLTFFKQEMPAVQFFWNGYKCKDWWNWGTAGLED